LHCSDVQKVSCHFQQMSSYTCNVLYTAIRMIIKAHLVPADHPILALLHREYHSLQKERDELTKKVGVGYSHSTSSVYCNWMQH